MGDPHPKTSKLSYNQHREIQQPSGRKRNNQILIRISRKRQQQHNTR